MEAFFIEPGSLPGGTEWAKACSAIPVPAKNASAEIIRNVDALRSSLRCDSSSMAGFFQVFLLLLVYGGILYYASNLIASGSELLLLIKSLRNIVGSVVLPILGAVPDGAIVLFSGLGPNAQEEVAVGVGALAGSTIMLLTIPWFLSILAGRVNIRADGVPMYHHKPRLWPANNFHLTKTGVEAKGMVQLAGKYMLLTSASYGVIQVIAFFSGTIFVSHHTKAGTVLAAAREHNWALFVFFLCSAFFMYYLYSQFVVTPEKKEFRGAVVTEVTIKKLHDKTISLTGAFDELWSIVRPPASEDTSLMEGHGNSERLNRILKTFFNEYDKDFNGVIDSYELEHLMTDLGERLSESELQKLHAEMDHDKSGVISFEEFRVAIPDFIRRRAAPFAHGSYTQVLDMESGAMRKEEQVEADSEEEEVPEDLKHEDPYTERRRILQRSFRMMITGTVLVLLFSDPMVGVMNDVGKRLGIPAFYISFALAPLASNASEVIAAYSYALKKTRRTVTISFSTLLGAAILNNTFVLSIFMLLIAAKGLAWQFTAETLSILFVEFAVAHFSRKPVQTMRDGLLVLALYPASIFIVAFLENIIGLD